MRYDYTPEHLITYGENRTLRIPVTDTMTGDPAASFTGWEFTFYIIPTLNSANGLIELEAKHLARLTAAAQTAPNVDFPLVPGSLPPNGKTYWYEFWRTDANNHRRLAHGLWPQLA